MDYTVTALTYNTPQKAIQIKKFFMSPLRTFYEIPHCTVDNFRILTIQPGGGDAYRMRR